MVNIRNDQDEEENTDVWYEDAEYLPDHAYRFPDGSMIWLRRPFWCMIELDGLDTSGHYRLCTVP